MQVALAVVLYAEVAALRHFLLAHLHVDPFGCALGRDVVALHDALYAHWAWRCDADYMVERYAAVESALEEYGAFEPLLAGSGEVVCHCGCTMSFMASLFASLARRNSASTGF